MVGEGPPGIDCLHMCDHSSLRGAVICMLDRKQSKLDIGQGSYAVILLVWPFGSLTIAKFNGVSLHCFVVAVYSALYVYYFRIYYHTWTIYINITILQN